MNIIKTTTNNPHLFSIDFITGIKLSVGAIGSTYLMYPDYTVTWGEGTNYRQV